jgi:hypothetical protein
MFIVKLSSVGNPDFQQYAPVSEPQTVKTRTLQGAVKACLDYIAYWNLGGGNWTSTPIHQSYKGKSLVIGWVSYNGKLWFRNPDDDDGSFENRQIAV